MSTVDPRPSCSLPRPPRAEKPGDPGAPEAAPEGTSEPEVARTGPLPVAPSQHLAAKVARSLWRRRKLAALTGLVGGWVVAGAIWLLIPAQNTAEVWLHIERAPREADKDDGAPALLVKSPLVLEAALHQRGIFDLLKRRPQPRPLDWLDQHIHADAGPDPAIVRVVAVSTRDDEPALFIVDAVAAAFIQETENRQQERLTQLKETCHEVQESLRSQRAALAALDKPQPQPPDGKREQLRRERADAQAELRQLLTRTPAPEGLTEEALASDTVIRKCDQEIERLTTQMKDHERISALGANDPKLARLATERDGWKTKRADRRKELTAANEQRNGGKSRAELQARQNALEELLASLDEQEKHLDAEAKTPASNDADNTKVQKLRDDVDAKQETARRLAADVQTLEAEAKAGPGVVRLGETRLHDNVNLVQRLLTAGLGGGATFLLLALLVGGVELRDQRVKVAHDIAHLEGLPLLGTLPDLITPPATSDTAPPDPLAEAVDVLRTLLMRRTGGGPCVIMVTSATDGEGKTALASHLAASLARAWRKTLLIDGDLRNPAIHKLFNTAAEPGLSDVLRGEADAVDAVQPTPLNRLWLLPAGRSDSHALQALAQTDGAAFLDDLRQQYELIVIDSSAVLSVADTLLLSLHVDVVVLTVRCGISRVPSVRAAQQRLGAMGAPLFGAVVVGS